MYASKRFFYYDIVNLLDVCKFLHLKLEIEQYTLIFREKYTILIHQY